jgi:hypothetical protein
MGTYNQQGGTTRRGRSESISWGFTAVVERRGSDRFGWLAFKKSCKQPNLFGPLVAAESFRWVYQGAGNNTCRVQRKTFGCYTKERGSWRLVSEAEGAEMGSRTGPSCRCGIARDACTWPNTELGAMLTMLERAGLGSSISVSAMGRWLEIDISIANM